MSFIGNYLPLTGGALSGSLAVDAAGSLSWTGHSQMQSPADGSVTLMNAAGSDFGLLQLGGTTSAFPALKRSTTVVIARLADDSADATIQARRLVISDDFLTWGSLTRLRGAVDGNLTMYNNAQTGFSLLQFGGTSSSFPALKRNSTAISVRLADDSADAPFTASTVSGTGLFTALSGTAVGAGANTQAFIKASSTSNLGVYYGTGNPSFSAAKGSLYVKTDATTTTTRLYVNTDGATTWTNFTSAA